MMVIFSKKTVENSKLVLKQSLGAVMKGGYP